MEENSLKLPRGTQLPETIEGCHRLIRELSTTLSALFKRVEKLEVENRELKERLTLNSSNSSLPPSSDFKKKKKKARSSGRGSHRSSGGQPGHPGHFRKLLAVSEVDVVKKCFLPPSCACGGIWAIEESYQRHQVFELPEMQLHVTEYQLEKGVCQCCQKNQMASLPSGVTWGITGPRLTSFMSELVAKYHLSRRELQEFLKEHLHFKLSLGTVFNKQKMMNTILEGPATQLQEAAKQSPCLNVDETSHNRDGKREWLWVMMSTTVAYFCIMTSRGKKAFASLIGDFKEVVISDRHTAYTLLDSSKRQLCWSHLRRDFQRLSDKSEPVISRLGKALLAHEANLFKCWHAFKEGKITREDLLRSTSSLRHQVGECLEKGSYTEPTLKAARFCNNLLKDFDALWTFLHMEGVEPTNNHAERGLRGLVIWRKKYFGTRSTYGSEYISRSASFFTTCKLQSKNAFKELCQITQNYFSGLPTSTFEISSS